METPSLSAQIAKLHEAAAKEAQSCGRNPKDIQIILVTKTVPANRVQEAFDTGHLDFGENRVQELLEKKKSLPESIRWHLIGHLQTNKVKQVIQEVALIHSLDRMELAREIQKQAEKKGLSKAACLIQVNTPGETTKFGLEPKDVEPFLESLAAFPLIQVRGLMTIGPNTQDETQIRQSFCETRQLRDMLQKKFPNLDFGILSMGMSGDFRIAIQEGSTLIRVGSAVFGAR